MGNIADSGLFMTTGVIGCSLGMTLENAIQKPVYRKIKVKNEKNDYKRQERNGGHRLDHISEDLLKRKVSKIYIRKSDLLWVGSNTSTSFGRICLEPAQSLKKAKESFWTEHWWIVFELDDGSFLTTYKSINGIFLHHTNSFSLANSQRYNGMGNDENKNVETLNFYEYEYCIRTVEEVVQKIKGVSSKYKVNEDDCQVFADQLYRWF